MRRLTVVLIVLVLAAPFGAGTAAAEGTVVAVAARGTSFSPALAEATLLDTVTWTNTEPEGSTVRHTVTATSGEWAINVDLAPGQSLSHTFDSAGTYGYRCLRHAGMTGQVVVGKGEDPTIVARHDFPPANATGVIPVTGSVAFGGEVVSDEPVTRVNIRSADYASTTFVVALDSAPPATVTQFDRINWTSGNAAHSIEALTGPAGADWALDVTVPKDGHLLHRFTKDGTYTYRCKLHPGNGTRTIVVSTPFSAWSEVVSSDGAWRTDIDFDPVAQGKRIYYEVRAETKRAYQANPTGFVVEVAHEPFDVVLLRDGIPIVDGDVVSGDVPLAFQVQHPSWEESRLDVRIWNTKSASGAPYYTGSTAAPELQTLSTSGSPTTLVRQGDGLYKIARDQTAKYYPGGKWATSTIPDGTYDIFVKPYVPSGATSTMTLETKFTVVVDNRRDVVDQAGGRHRVDLGKVAGNQTLRGTVDAPPEGGTAPTGVEWTVLTNSDCTANTRWLTSASWTPATFDPVTRVWSLTYTTTAIASGTRCIDVRALPASVDGAVYSRLRYRMDLHNLPSVDFETPAAAARVSGVVALAGNATTGAFPITKMELQVGAGSFVTIGAASGGRWTHALETKALANGTHALTVRATNLAGTATATRSIVLANEASVAIVAPAQGDTITGAAAVVSGTVGSVGYPVSKVEVTVGGVARLATVSGSTWSYALDTTVLANGAHTMTATVTTAAKTVTTPARSFNVANAAFRDLSVTIAAPTAPAAPFVVSVPVTGTVVNTGNDPVPKAKADLRIEYFDGATWRLVVANLQPATDVPGFGSATFTHTWARPTTEVYVGRFPIRVTVDAVPDVDETSEANNTAIGSALWVTDRAPVRLAPDRATDVVAALQGCANGTPSANPDAKAVCDAVVPLHQNVTGTVECAKDARTPPRGHATASTLCTHVSAARNSTSAAVGSASQNATAFATCADGGEPPEADGVGKDGCLLLETVRGFDPSDLRAEMLVNGGLEGPATAANGFELFYPGAAVVAGGGVDGSQAVDLAVAGTTAQPWDALGNLRILPERPFRLREIEEFSYSYRLPASPSTPVRLQHYFILDIDGDGQRDACLLHTPMTSLEATPEWTRATFDRSSLYFLGDGGCPGGVSVVPLATVQAALGHAWVLRANVQTNTAPPGPWPAGEAVLVDDVSLVASPADRDGNGVPDAFETSAEARSSALHGRASTTAPPERGPGEAVSDARRHVFLP